MANNLLCLFLVSTLLFVLSGANHVTNVKAIHAIPDGPAIDIYVSGIRTRSGVQYGSMTGYVPIPKGEVLVQITEAGVSPSTAVLISKNIDLVGGDYLTIAAVGSVSDLDQYPLALFVIQDEIDIPAEQALLRTLYLSPSAVNIDVINRPVTLWANVSYPGAGEPDYLLLSAGVPYQLEVQATLGSDAILAGPTFINLPRNSANTIFVVGVVGSRSSPLTIVYSRDFVTGQVSPSVTTTRTPSTTLTVSPTPSRTLTASATRSLGSTLSVSPTISDSGTLTPLVTRSPFRTHFQDDDDGEFTRSATPIPVFSRSPFRTIVPESSTPTFTPRIDLASPLPSTAPAPFPSPFLSRTPFRTVAPNEYDSSSSGSDDSASSIVSISWMLLASLIYFAM